ncbi:DUF6308 family protein [Janibacter sp. Y6]|uniref:DUF6308 family protein n=1 Tax=Janibacter sp. Y6 TaxID=2913552 RepID=UPI0034A5866D
MRTSTPPPVQILFTYADHLNAQLGGLGADRELASLSAAEARDLEEQNRPLWSAVRKLHDVGVTRTSKLLARKRPNLIPIYDSVILSVSSDTDCRRP